MLEIARHIEYLLTEHDCVLIPGLGGLVLQEVPARLSSDGTWLPPTRSLVFNPSLTYNDGLLAASIMRARRTDYQRASALIGQEVSTLRSLLRREGDRVSFGEIGHFVLGEDKILSFEVSEKYLIDLRQFGMAPVRLLPLRELSSQKEREKKSADRPAEKDDVIRITIRRSTVRRALAAAAVFLLLFFTATPFTDITPTENHASLSPVVTVADDMNNRAANGEYLIVVSTLSTRENALLQLQRFHNSGVSEPIFLHETGNRVYLYTRTFTDRQEAYAYLRATLQGDTPFPDAWVMKAAPALSE